MTKLVCSVLGCVLAIASASCVSATDTVVQRAPTDLHCKNVSVQELSSTAYVARGCGSEITYTCRCVQFYGAQCLDLACSPDMARLAETSGGQTESQAAGCQYDTQCKGERICRSGRCVDPPAPRSTYAAGAAPTGAQRSQ
jgi:hypothetical protein